MNKKSISSLELAALMNELQFLVRGKVSQIYHPEKKELILQLYASGKGKQLLKIVPGKFLCLTTEKKSILNPTGFCMQLRKYLNNSVIKNLYQKDSERIVVFELLKEEPFYLIIELFSKGNIVLTDKNYLIIGTLERQIWKDRVVKPKERYIFPKASVNWKKLSEKELGKILEKSEKRSVAVSLATEIGLGGVYAEEICKMTEINKNKLPSEITNEEIKKMIKAVKKFITLISLPKGYIYENQLTPFPLFNEETNKIEKTYNQVINLLNPFELISPYDKRIGAIERTIKMQEEAIDKQQKKIELNKKKGEEIYENYQKIDKLLKIVADLKDKKGWAEVGLELKKFKKISNINLKDKKITVKL